MEFKPMHRLLSIMLCFTMLSALTIVGMVSAESEELIARKMISWKGQELADEAQKTGLTNRHGEAIFTTYQDQIGLQAPKGSNDYMIHSWSLPHQQGETPLYQQGDLLSMVLRVWNPDDDLEEGDFITPELCYDWSGVNAIFGETMTAEDYSNATTYIDENYGYEYKEWSVMAVLDSDVYDQMDLLFQIRVRSHGNGTLNLYGLSV